MDVIRFFIVVLVLVVSIPGGINAQVSNGGSPLAVPALKSSEAKMIEMPAVKNELLKQASINSYEESNQLKPLRFAHAFDVQLNTKNSGEWFNAGNGYYCWKLKIRSRGAKSINLIFDRFKLSENARLFVYNKDLILGSFTAFNNKKSGKFAVAPVPGDEIIIQYEVPEENYPANDFDIVNVNHDYVGILKYSDRRPLGKTAGLCNIDVNCEIGNNWGDVKNSVCRMIVHGKELCTGSLINNTAEDQKPFIISASHCYDKWDYAETTVYVFNYESPYCAPLDGDPGNSISGAVMRAQFDSMDFALAEMSLVPPPDYRPYFAGWDRSINLPDSSVSIHHPQGDIKKISFDNDPPVISDFNSNYTQKGFYKIVVWDNGVTEIGSSGGPLFNPDKRLIGTLTGGVASCNNPVRDYYSRFAKSWDYNSDTSKQLKYWLDPIHSNAENVDGKNFNAGIDLCASYTNLEDIDEHENIYAIISGKVEGYWGGSNKIGITEFMERYDIAGNEQISGISIGIGRIGGSITNSDSTIAIKVYKGDIQPEELIYEEKFPTKHLARDAMNYFGFSEMVEPSGPFFIGFELQQLPENDTFVVYQTYREAHLENHFYYKQNGSWKNFKEESPNGVGITNAFELVVCNIDDLGSDTPKVNNPLEIFVFPNPVSSEFIIEAGEEIREENITVYNLIGKTTDIHFSKIHEKKVKINMDGNVPGVYFVRFKTSKGTVSRKISYVPW